MPALAQALTDPGAVLDLPAATAEEARVETLPQDTPRQLAGQPASPGLASGRVCRITAGEDIGTFRAGIVLVCDAIQPMMPHLVTVDGHLGIVTVGPPEFDLELA